jgi:hypothetical protein
MAAASILHLRIRQMHISRNPCSRLCLSAVVLITALPGIFVLLTSQPAAGEDVDETRRTHRLEAMKRSATQYKLFEADDPGQPFQFVEAPVMRWTNPVNAAKDGTVFLWTRAHRPQAILQLYTFDDEHFSHEWQSLAESTIVAEVNEKPVWNPAEPGLRFANLKEAERPAASPAARLRQMKGLAEKFSSTFLPYVAAETDQPVELRLLPQPLYRYESTDAAVIDGTLFAFVQGTDPQSLLVIEAARERDASSVWRFAFARLASGAVAARFEDRQVFGVSKYDFRHDPAQTFLLLPRQPAPP